MKFPQSTRALVYHGLAWDAAQAAAGSRTGACSQLLRMEERPLGKLGPGMALVRVEAAPVNPSDLLYLQGQYGVRPKAGDVPGFEGCGTVLAANAGPYGWWLTGKRVSFGSQDGNGSWAEYCVVSVFSCIPVSRQLATQSAATLIVNPMTALGLIERVKRERSRAFVVNAAGSALGKYLLDLAKYHKLKFIGVVRREETKRDLLQAGAAEVLNTRCHDFIDRFRRICQQMRPRVLLDAVAGHETAKLMNCMPERSLAIVYGKLDDESVDRESKVSSVAVDADGLVFRKQRIEGYWLTHELHGLRGAITPLLRARKIGQLHRRGVLRGGDFEESTLEDLAAKIEERVSKTKLLLIPHPLGAVPTNSTAGATVG